MRAHDDAAAGAEGKPGLIPRGGSPTDPGWAAGRPPARRGPGRSRALALLVLAPLGLACSELTAPPTHRRTPADAPAANAPVNTPQSPSTLVVAEKTPPVPVPADQVEASHILVSYQGATRAKPTVTRTREQALALATQLAGRAREPNADFAQIAKDASDGPSGVEGGVLPRFGRQQMVKPFSDAAFALRPGEISGVVETNFGFHIIKRLQ
jgi:peptidyl-prolyl cis-trans isomerase NIMA-interacting 1